MRWNYLQQVLYNSATPLERILFDVSKKEEIIIIIFIIYICVCSPRRILWGQ